jgi:hypothetical protein
MREAIPPLPSIPSWYGAQGQLYLLPFVMFGKFIVGMLLLPKVLFALGNFW